MILASRLSRLALPLAALALVAGTAWARPEGKPERQPKGKPERAEAVSAARPARAESPKPPPPPPVVFREEPEVILIPKTRVYYVSDLRYDLFRYGRHWYINSAGNWYRARGYSGPYEYLDFERVPSTILRLPEKFHRQPLRPGGSR